jgi:peptide/nickel transport system ATP-binding protein
VNALLDVRDLRVEFHTSEGVGRAVNGVDFCINEGQVLGIVGESGSGKSAVAMALVNLVARPGRIVSGSVIYRDRDLLRESERSLQQIRGREIGLVVQNPKPALNPLLTIGRQLVNVIRGHGKLERKAAAEHAVEMLRKVGIPDPETRMHAYPHHLSGGMAQRVVIAVALSNNPHLLIADEPTSGLDVTIQAQILDLIQALVDELHSATILISRDLGIIAQHCEEVAVLCAGLVVERAPVRAFFRDPLHPYSQALIKAVSTTRQRGRKLMSGTNPSIYELPKGCALSSRCPLAQPICLQTQPDLLELAPGHFVRCHVRAAGRA